MRKLTKWCAKLGLGRTCQNVLWLLRLEWAGGARWYGHRPVDLEDGTVEPVLIEPGRLELKGWQTFGPGRVRAEMRLRCRLALDGGDDPTLRELLGKEELEGLELQWGVVVLPRNSPWRRDRWMPLFRGRVATCRVERGTLSLEALDPLALCGGNPLGTVWSRRQLPEPFLHDQGCRPPLLWGQLDGVQLMPWRLGVPLKLADHVAPHDTVIAVESLEGLPPSGAVQIGDEWLVYAALDRDNNTLGRPKTPLHRPEPARHGIGSSARLIPPNGFEWLLAGHECRRVGTVRAEGYIQSPSLYTVATENWEGRNVQKVIFPKWPTHPEYRSTLSTRLLQGGLYWKVDETNLALNPEAAYDRTGELGTAELTALHHSRLELRWKGPLRRGERWHGLLTAAALRLRISATRGWDYSTRVRLQFSRGSLFKERLLPRPQEDSTWTLLPGHSHGDGPESEALPIRLRYGPEEWRLDLTDLLDPEDPWALFDDADGFLLSVVVDSEGDSTRFFVEDAGLEIDIYPRLNVRMAGNLWAEAEGMEEEGTLLENPARILQNLLTRDDGANLPEDWLEEEEWDAAVLALEGKDYRFALATTRLNLSLQSAVDRLLGEARCVLMPSGNGYRLLFQEGETERITEAVETLRDHFWQGRELALDREGEDDLLREIRLYNRQDFSGEENLSWRGKLWLEGPRVSPPAGSSGQVLTENLLWHNHPESETTPDLGAFLLRLHGLRHGRISTRLPLAFLATEPGDSIRLEEEVFPLNLGQGRVEVVEVTASHGLDITARFPLPGEICWAHETGDTFLLHRPGNRLLEFWLENRLVAMADPGGNLHLRGSLREEASALLDTQTEAIHFNCAVDKLIFATGADEDWMPRFALDGQGNLTVYGRVREADSTGQQTLTGSCIAAGSDFFAKALADNFSILLYDGPARLLRLRGILTEQSVFP